MALRSMAQGRKSLSLESRLRDRDLHAGGLLGSALGSNTLMGGWGVEIGQEGSLSCDQLQ